MSKEEIEKQFLMQRDNWTLEDSSIPKACAIAYIDNYRNSVPNTPPDSVWIDVEDLRHFLTESVMKNNVTGIRVYMAKYKEDGNGCIQEVPPGLVTVILALTKSDGAGKHIDIDEAFYDYGNPCPPHCGKGEHR